MSQERKGDAVTYAVLTGGLWLVALLAAAVVTLATRVAAVVVDAIRAEVTSRG